MQFCLYPLAVAFSNDHVEGDRRVSLTAMLRNLGEAKQLHQKLARVCDRFLDVALEFMGHVPSDERLKQAIRRQSAVVDLWPSSRSGMAFKQLAGAVDTWGEPERVGLDRIAFFSRQAAVANGW